MSKPLTMNKEVTPARSHVLLLLLVSELRQKTHNASESLGQAAERTCTDHCNLLHIYRVQLNLQPVVTDSNPVVGLFPPFVMQIFPTSPSFAPP